MLVPDFEKQCERLSDIAFYLICGHGWILRNLFWNKEIVVNERKLILVSKIAKFNETAQEKE